MARLIFYHPSNKNICVPCTLRSYSRKRSPIREGRTSLFLSFKKPFNTLRTQTLSCWLKDTLNDSGIDRDVFTRGNFASKKHRLDSDTKRKKQI